MANSSIKGSRIPARFLPGKNESGLLDKLNVPQIDITYIRSYLHRTKAWRVEGYYPSRPSSKKAKEYRLNINGFKAWKIGFKNKQQTPVDITLHFRIQGKYVPGYDYNQTYSNLLPDMKAEMVVVPGLKMVRVRLDKVEIHTGSNLLSSTEVRTFMPYWNGNFVFSFITACLLGVSFLFCHTYKQGIPVHNSTTNWIAILGFYLAFWEAFNITPVIIMLLALLVGPFFLHDQVQKIALMVLGCFYLWAVWRKRSSIKDFLIGAFIP
ncbi:MAG: hypothetical protein ACJ751_10530 [Niastella sp.]|uniref:hypothetical protein n=1 Tax=Niastella sp. TaxID=1869183 RepID=UPI003899908A